MSDLTQNQNIVILGLIIPVGFIVQYSCAYTLYLDSIRLTVIAVV